VNAWKKRGEPTQGTAFPICRDLEEWSTRGTKKRLAYLSDAGASAIEAVQPFNGVRWTLRLREIGNLDRHRQAIVLAPTINWTCPRDFTGLGRTALPTHISVNALVGDELGPPFQDEAQRIFDGAVGLLNPFLAHEGHDPDAVAVEPLKQASQSTMPSPGMRSSA
jgi:hypothetical protein